ncbi:protein of unknown function [Xenorhabdus nematophila AN6/1]|nr:protein of unknown function [Xenorhabdus nematophila AN6/1]
MIDEGHITTTNPLLSPYMTKVVKMWRKLGAWLWLATQNLADYPDTAEKMLNMGAIMLAPTQSNAAGLSLTLPQVTGPSGPAHTRQTALAGASNTSRERQSRERDLPRCWKPIPKRTLSN